MGSTSFGIGESLLTGDIIGLVDHFSFGRRVTDRNWISATYGHGRAIGYGPAGLEQSDHGSTLNEASVGFGHMACTTLRRACLALIAGLGYQHADIALFDEFDEPQVTFADYSNVFVEGKLALRFNFGYVWLEGSFAVRPTFHTDDARDTTGTQRVWGLALHAVL